MSAEYRCGFSATYPANIYACREFEMRVNLGCHRESGSGPGVVYPSGVVIHWYVDGVYMGDTRTDGNGWSYKKIHLAEPGSHVIRVVFDGLQTSDAYYRPSTADFTVSAKPPPVVLSVIVASGKGTTTPIPGTHYYDKGAVVKLEAKPSRGYVLDYWLVDDKPYLREELEVTMDRDHVAKAYFSPGFRPLRPVITLLLYAFRRIAGR